MNCRGLATVLNECYLSMGIPSRVITCMPKTYINDCHVINAVYSSTLGKWLWIDPTNNAWVTDEQGNLLSVEEVRARLRNGQPVQVNEDANWNNEKKTTTEDYLYEYMAKNLFYLESWTRLWVQHGKRPGEAHQLHLPATYWLRQRGTEPEELFRQRRPILLAGSSTSEN